MTRIIRLLSTTDRVAEAAVAVAKPPNHSNPFESNSVVIVAALALIFIVCIIMLVRWAWPAYRSSWNPISSLLIEETRSRPTEVIPKFTYNSSMEDKGCGKLTSSDCAICLAEYVNGDEIRVLPLCGHGFHVDCIDMWLASHSSCPSCRQVHNGEFTTI